jgi:hypothetical protein
MEVMHIRNIPGARATSTTATWVARRAGPRADPQQLRAAFLKMGLPERRGRPARPVISPPPNWKNRL